MKRTGAFVLALFLMLGLCACGNSAAREAYKEAKRLFESGEYQAAAEKYSECGDYKDAKEMVSEAHYQYGLQLLEEKNYTKAKKEFASLGEYSNSADMKLECDYQQAMGYMDEGDYDSAEIRLSSLGDYKDSKEMIKECRYQVACKALKNKNYMEANKAFAMLYDYKDSSEMAKESLYLYALSLVKDKKYLEAKEVFTKIPEYKDVPEYLARYSEEKVLKWVKVTRTDNLGNSDTHIEDYEYNDFGQLVKREVSQGGELFNTCPYNHAWADQYVLFLNAWSENYDYDASGRLTRIVWKCGRTTTMETSFEYNENGQIIKENTTTGDDEGYMALTYDDYGRLVTVSGDSKHNFSIYYTYDEYGNVLTSYNTLFYGYRYVHNYTYDNGKIVEDTVNTSFGLNYHDIYSYDGDGLLVRIDRDYYGKEPNEVYRFQYEKISVFR